MLNWKLAKESKPRQGERVLLKIGYENCPVVGYWGCGGWEVCTVNHYADGDAIVERAFESSDVTHYAEIGNLPDDL